MRLQMVGVVVRGVERAKGTQDGGLSGGPLGMCGRGAWQSQVKCPAWDEVQRTMAGCLLHDCDQGRGASQRADHGPLRALDFL
jgi:hypothetical protein